MSVYIKDMEIPKCCAECDIEGYYENSYGMKYGFFCHLGCKEYTEDTRDTKRLNNCPLAPVPPHGRLGDLDQLEQMFVDIDNAPYSSFDGEEPFYSAADAAQIIRLAPTVIQADPPKE